MGLRPWAFASVQTPLPASRRLQMRMGGLSSGVPGAGGRCAGDGTLQLQHSVINQHLLWCLPPRPKGPDCDDLHDCR